MKSIKGFITLTGGVCFMMGALATAAMAADDVSSNDKASAVAQASPDVMAPAVADVSLNAKPPLLADVTARPTLATIWDKHQCFIVLSGSCL